MLKETIEYYNENNTDCYLLLLDASKAFDRVEYMKLFNTLRHRKMCPLVLRLLMNMYINQQIQVKWNSTMSMKSSISNGVKQGGCLSPNLFIVYFDKLIEILRKCNIGCRYGNHYMGVYIVMLTTLVYYLQHLPGMRIFRNSGIFSTSEVILVEIPDPV